jgi:EF hand
MKLKFVFTLLLSATIFSANIALADHHEGGHGNKEKYKTSADANKDGKLTYDEYKLHNEGRYKKKFEHMDANKDGTLDEAELKTIHEVGSSCDHHKMDKAPAANKT